MREGCEGVKIDKLRMSKNEMKREMRGRVFNDVRSSNTPDGREVSLLEYKVQMEDG